MSLVWRDGRMIEDGSGADPILAGWGVFTTVGCDDGRPLLWEQHRNRLIASLGHLLPAVPVELPDERDLGGLLDGAGLGGPAKLRVVVSRRSGAGAPSGTPPERENNEGELARQLHQLPATDGDARRPSGRKPNRARRLAGLATEPGEICCHERVSGRDSWWEVEASAAPCDAVGPSIAPIRLAVERWQAFPPLGGHKTLARLPWDLAHERAKSTGAGDVLLVDDLESVLETAVANVWVLRGGEVRTPPAPARCLPGVMRDWLMKRLPGLGLRVEDGDVDLAELARADEVWLSNAVVGVRRVADAAGRSWNRWPVFERLEGLGIPAPGWPSPS
ncbi:MAG: aminotransferase class IV [Thermoanaerobaculales bacterium]